MTRKRNSIRLLAVILRIHRVSCNPRYTTNETHAEEPLGRLTLGKKMSEMSGREIFLRSVLITYLQLYKIRLHQERIPVGERSPEIVLFVCACVKAIVHFI